MQSWALIRAGVLRASGLPGYSSKSWIPGTAGCFWAKPREWGIECHSIGQGNHSLFAKSSSNLSMFQVKYFAFNKLPFSNKNLSSWNVSNQLESQVKMNVWSSVWCQFVLITCSSISKEKMYVFASLSARSSLACYCQDLEFICEPIGKKLSIYLPLLCWAQLLLPFHESCVKQEIV